MRHPETRLHLFGVTRCEHINAFSAFGVASFDSTSPLRQAFKHDSENYYTSEKLYAAIRVPQVEGNAKMQQRIVSGRRQPGGGAAPGAGLPGSAERSYDRDGKGDGEGPEAAARVRPACTTAGRTAPTDYRRDATGPPWKRCPCEICRRLGIHVVLFRGAERNRRRGFHNLFVTYRRVHAELARMDKAG